MFKRKKRKVPSLNTTSTADISFMLLILFLVTSSMDVDKGLTRQLPPVIPEEQKEITDIDQHNVLQLHIMADGSLMCNESLLPIEQLQERVQTFVSVEANRLKHVIQLETDREANYDVYFQVQNAIVRAYHHLRDLQARKQYGKPMTQCSAEEQLSLRDYYPQRIAEVNNSPISADNKIQVSDIQQKGGSR